MSSQSYFSPPRSLSTVPFWCSVASHTALEFRKMYHLNQFVFNRDVLICFLMHPKGKLVLQGPH